MTSVKLIEVICIEQHCWASSIHSPLVTILTQNECYYSKHWYAITLTIIPSIGVETNTSTKHMCGNWPITLIWISAILWLKCQNNGSNFDNYQRFLTNSSHKYQIAVVTLFNYMWNKSQHMNTHWLLLWQITKTIFSQL